MNFDGERQSGTPFFEEDFVSSEGGGQENQDCVGSLTVQGKRCWVVADGVGGQRGGRIASHLAVDAVLEEFKANPRMDQASVKSYIESAHREIVSKQKVEASVAGMKSTLAMLVSDGRSAVWGHVGDSRVYHFRDGKVIFQTQDHSYSQAKVTMGQMSVEDIRHDPDRSVLLDAVGKEGFRGATVWPRPGEEPVRLLRRDAFLLCVDGFWGLVQETEMEIDLAKSDKAQDWLRFMRQRVDKRLTSGSDNYTAYAIQIVTSGLPAPSTIPAPSAFKQQVVSPPAQPAAPAAPPVFPPLSSRPPSPLGPSPSTASPGSPSLGQRQQATHQVPPVAQWTITDTVTQHAATSVWEAPSPPTTFLCSQRFIYALIAIAVVVIAVLMAVIFISKRPAKIVGPPAPGRPRVAENEDCKPTTRPALDQSNWPEKPVILQFNHTPHGPLTLAVYTAAGIMAETGQLSEYSVSVKPKKLELDRGGKKQLFTLQKPNEFKPAEIDCIRGAASGLRH